MTLKQSVRGNFQNPADFHQAFFYAIQGNELFQKGIQAFLSMDNENYYRVDWNYQPSLSQPTPLWMLTFAASHDHFWAKIILTKLLRLSILPVLRWNVVAGSGDNEGMTPFWFIIREGLKAKPARWAANALAQILNSKKENWDGLGWDIPAKVGEHSGETPASLLATARKSIVTHLH